MLKINLPRRKSVAEELYEYLRKAILEGQLEAGERLTEQAVARSAAISRTPVREAIHKLEVDGLIETQAGSATIVDLTLSQFGEISVVRETLEGLAAQLAAQSRSELDMATLKHLRERWRAAAKARDPKELRRIAIAYQQAVWAASGNSYLSNELTILSGLMLRVERERSRFDNTDRIKIVGAELDALTAAIEAKDPAEAERIAVERFRRIDAMLVAQATIEGARISV
jgi:DNA-binding GntR family transcriptional regulator